MKAAKMCMVQCRLVATNDDFTMRMDELEAKISADRAKNLIPFLVGCTSG
jgi:glutamate/tyrosine decarboxylase-like PLP-dependent enzyme